MARPVVTARSPRLIRNAKIEIQLPVLTYYEMQFTSMAAGYLLAHRIS